MVVADRPPSDRRAGSGLDPAAMLTPSEVASLLGVSTKTVGRWGDRGTLTVRRTTGGHRRFRAGDVLALLAGREEVGEP